MPKCDIHGVFFCKAKSCQVPEASTGRTARYEPRFQTLRPRGAGKSVKKIIQFGYNVKVPDEVKNGEAAVIDCRCIENPYGKTSDMVKARWIVRHDPNFDRLVREGMDVIRAHLAPVVAVGCGYGVHRSGTVVEALRRLCEQEGIDVEVVNMGRDA